MALFLASAARLEALSPPQAGAGIEVDFGTTNLGRGEDGFFTFKCPAAGVAGPLTRTYGKFSVSMANGATVDASGRLASAAALLSRDRGNPSADAGVFTYDKLYRDFLCGAATLAVQIEGLVPGEAYTVVFYAYDHTLPGNVAFVNITGATTAEPHGVNVPLGSLTWTAGTAFSGTTSNHVQSLTARVTADASGRLTFRQSGAGNCLNGLRVFVPPVVAVDFGQTQAPSLVETGFEEFGISNYPGIVGPVEWTFKNGVVRLAATGSVDAAGRLNGAGSFLGRDRGQPAADGGDFTFNDLYRDFVTVNAAEMGVQIEGLLPETPYDVQFYYYDHNNTRTATFTNITGAEPDSPDGAGMSLGSVGSTAGYVFSGETSNEVFALTARVTTDESGRLTFRQHVAQGAALNGMAIWAPPAKPDPLPRRMGFFAGGRDYLPDLRIAESWLGKPVETSVDFMETKEWPSGTISWTGFDHGVNYVTDPAASWPATRWWVAYSIPLIIYQAHSNALFGTTLADVAAGQHLDHFERLAEKLVERGEEDAYIRLSHEMNGGWYNWSVTDSSTAAAFRGAWIRVVQRMRSVAGQRFRFDFNPAAEGVTQHYPLYPEAWPGAYYVSCVGVDLYDVGKNGAVQFGDVRWSQLLGQDNPQSQGLLFWSNMAAVRGLPISLPEWATGGAGWGSGGDSPYFIRKVHQWLSGRDVAYHCYWDSTSGWNGCLSDGHFPLAAAVFRELFGRDEFAGGDVGAVGLAGAATWNPGLKQYAIESAGAGLGGNADALHFVRTPKTGNYSFQARLRSISNTASTAAAGVMIREDDSAGAPFVFAGMSQAWTAFVKYRAVAGGPVATSYSAGGTRPILFRLVRTGDTFSAFRSYDGLTWTALGPALTIPMAAETLAGIAASSTNPAQLNVSLFDQVNEPLEIIVDSESPVSGGTVVASPSDSAWPAGTAPAEFHGVALRHDGNTGKGDAKHVVFTPTVAESGEYNVYIWHAMGADQATNVPVIITHAGGSTTRIVNQQHEGDDWHMLGTFSFTAGAGHNVKVCTKAPGGGAVTNGTVQADAIRLWRAR
jgi:hypothetical protein